VQIDLQHPLVIDSILLYNEPPGIGTGKRITSISRDGDAWFAETGPVSKSRRIQLFVYYHGKPREAVNPPWDGGLIWKKDRNKRPFVSVACQSLGASCWYPCKDYQGDEPDSAATHFTVPDTLTALGNGRLRNKAFLPGNRVTYSWAVTVPINNYNIVPYIGDYRHFGERYQGLEGPLDMDYWVLSYNLDAAKKQFTDATRMMKALEYWLGSYPFYADGYKLVEAPHLGMEHQSAIAYGNYYMKGYMGSDLSGSGWGLKWDYIIVHESGHEWFGNNITTPDIADMWVQEGFTTYTETLFTEYFYGKKAGEEYVAGQRSRIENDVPVIGPYGVNKEGSGDMYFKGANLLHMIRHIIGDDEKFRRMLNVMGRKFRHQVVSSATIESFMTTESGIQLQPLFDQYLRTTDIPVLEYRFRGNVLHYRFSNCNKDFVMPVKIMLSKGEAKQVCITPTTEWKELKLPAGITGGYLQVDRNCYVEVKKTD
jgi:aminopeptidase N